MGKEVRLVVEMQLDKIIHLAALDATITILRRKLDEIPEAIERRRSRYKEAEGKLEGAREALASMQKQHRQAEGELDSHLEKIRKLNDQQSLVKTNKEYQALLAEIERLKKDQDVYEEKILELMEKSSDIESNISAVAKEVEGAKKTFEVEEKKLLAEADELKAELDQVEGLKREMLPSIEDENLQMYSRVKALRGDAVAEVRDELCLGCRVSVPPQKYADVIMKQTIQTCSHCHRILFHRREKQPEKEAG